jgi:hypothetical protein
MVNRRKCGKLFGAFPLEGFEALLVCIMIIHVSLCSTHALIQASCVNSASFFAASADTIQSILCLE